MRIQSFSPRPACILLTMAAPALLGQVSLQVTIGPPPIPVYDQPMVPGPDYIWTPGYWAWEGDAFLFHMGYWAPEVGYYGGINYGFGYGGAGFDGGHWQGREYYYNRAVTHVDTQRVSRVYSEAPRVATSTLVSYNGGAGGLRAAPTAKERSMMQERHLPPTAEQTRHHETAGHERNLLASVNQGRPAVAATVKPADFTPGNVVPAKAAGGHVEEATLKATPKTMPPPPAAAKPAQQARPQPSGPQRPTPGVRPFSEPPPRSGQVPGAPAGSRIHSQAV